MEYVWELSFVIWDFERYALCTMLFASIRKEERIMGKFEGVIKAEIVRLAKREVRKITVPLGRDLRSMKNRVSQIRKTLLSLERLAAEQQKELGKGRVPLEASPDSIRCIR